MLNHTIARPTIGSLPVLFLWHDTWWHGTTTASLPLTMGLWLHVVAPAGPKRKHHNIFIDAQHAPPIPVEGFLPWPGTVLYVALEQL
jgi:hypothetical protein